MYLINHEALTLMIILFSNYVKHLDDFLGHSQSLGNKMGQMNACVIAEEIPKRQELWFTSFLQLTLAVSSHNSV